MVLAAYCAVISLLVVRGVAALALQNRPHWLWAQHQRGISICLGTVGVLLFIISQQPYAAVLAFALLLIKGWTRLKQR